MRIELEQTEMSGGVVVSSWNDLANGSGGAGVYGNNSGVEGLCQQQWSEPSGLYRIDLKYWDTASGSGTITVRVLSDLASRTIKASKVVYPTGLYSNPAAVNRTIAAVLEAVQIDTGDWLEVGLLKGSNTWPYADYIEVELVAPPPPANTPPTATDDSATVTSGGSILIPILDNDSDPDGDGLVLQSVSTPTHGTATINGASISYTAPANYVGPDSFTYTVADGNGGTDTGTVSVTVQATNQPPVAADDYVTVLENNTILIPALANDSDPDSNPLTLETVNTPQNGTATMADGSIAYTPNPGFVGSDTFTYGITDGQGGGTMATVHVTVAEDLSLPPAQEIDYLLKEKLYPFETTFVNDGDTVQGKAHLGFGVTIHETVRLLGINCPTVNTATGQLARARVQEILFEAAIAVRVETESTGKYGRWLGILWYQDGTTAEHEWLSLNQLLLDENLAVAYDGTTPAT
ncbi:Ig-like domain-containing protein [Halomicronema sp. CCY15110]|uniref:Ig-like domain-containing protein n=1 Tax=Halomicronema sp. CCY15110 TaxID=2767773 RepID=UPI001950A468|nr:Ig-like domain-containing protein [Halomicronema sp. CCY15110]